MLALLLLAASANAWEVSIESSAEAQVLVTITNPFDRAVTFCTWGTPLEANSDVFRGDIFDVSAPGVEVQYIGILERKFPILSDFLTLQPGQSVQAPMNLFKGYWFPVKGSYKINLNTVVAYTFNLALDLNAVTRQTLASEFQTEDMISDVLEMEIMNPTSPPIWSQPAVGSGGPSARNCSTSETNQINTAGNNAISATRQGYNYLPTSCTSSLSYYITWFGACASDRFSKVKSVLSSTLSALQASYPVQCGSSTCCANCYAFVYPTDTAHTVYVCSYFWRVPSGNCVMDSQPGTIIHEMSHFNNVGATKDTAYGQPNCKALATNNPAAAVQNADNYCFYTDSCPR